MANQNTDLDLIIDKINQHNDILVCSHFNPDADAYGSSCGLATSLKLLGKNVICLNADGSSIRYNCIPTINEVTSKIPEGHWPLVITCDSGSKARLGDEYQDSVITPQRFTINIDHHVSNSYFGDYNFVIANASSTAEVIYNILEKAKWPINSDVANALLSGIYGDTGSFRYSSTSIETFRVAQKLIEQGANSVKIASELFSRKPLVSAKLQARAYLDMKVIANGKIAYTVITDQIMKDLGAKPEDTEGLVESIRDIDGVIVAAFIYWHTDLWKLSLRSKQQTSNVSKVAEKFGGGGHIQAAAFRWRKSLEQLLQELLPELENIVK
jgi:phosphoesterase RecJ-like protein